nr:hypothetical protein [Tanacetum cinerariifolium]
MASQSTSTTAGAGSSSAPTVVSILPNNRNPLIWKDFNICLMSDNTKKAQCIHCLYFFSKDFNSTLKNHISHPHCEALKRAVEPRQSSMSRDESIFVYNPDVLREQFAGFECSWFDEEYCLKESPTKDVLQWYEDVKDHDEEEMDEEDAEIDEESDDQKDDSNDELWSPKIKGGSSKSTPTTKKLLVKSSKPIRNCIIG